MKRVVALSFQQVKFSSRRPPRVQRQRSSQKNSPAPQGGVDLTLLSCRYCMTMSGLHPNLSPPRSTTRNTACCLRESMYKDTRGRGGDIEMGSMKDIWGSRCAQPANASSLESDRAVVSRELASKIVCEGSAMAIREDNWRMATPIREWY